LANVKQPYNWQTLVQTFDTITGQISLVWDDAINSGTVRPGRYGYPGNDHNQLVITQ